MRSLLRSMMLLLVSGALVLACTTEAYHGGPDSGPATSGAGGRAADAGTAGVPTGGMPADGEAGDRAVPSDGSAGAPDGGEDAAPLPPDPVIALPGGVVRVEVWGDNIVRILYGGVGSVPAASLAVVGRRPKTPFTVEEAPAATTVTTARLSARVDKTSGQVTFKDAAGAVILTEAATTPHQLIPGNEGAGKYQAIASFATRSGERFYGLGEHQQSQGGKLAYSGSVALLHMNPGETGIPMLVSSGGYGIFWDNPSITKVDTGVALTFSSERGSLLDYCFIAGKADAVVAGYRALTGQAPLLGRWALGYWQSKNRYASQQELLGVAATYRQKQIPVDGIVQDYFYWINKPWGSHLFGTGYPDPAGMFKSLHDSGFHAMISVWPMFAAGSANYDALKSANNFLTPPLSDGTSFYYDAFKSDARKMYWDQISAALFSKGVDGWWLDASEPQINARWGEIRDANTSVGKGALVANAYPLMTTTAVHDGQRAATNDRRVFILTRSAYAGQQRNAATTWTGDITSDWPSFKRQIPAGLNFELSGIPYWTTDTGGYLESPLGDVTTAAYTELFERWLQFSAFCPIFRTHGKGPDRNLYSFGPQAEPILVAIDRLRYRLLPYIYSMSWMVTNRAYTPMRALVFDFPDDVKALDIPDQFMFGPAFLVNPVTDAGASSRSVYLPSGPSWYDFWTGATTQGGRTVTAAAPIDHLPLFVRAGSIVPLGPVLQFAEQRAADPIELRVYQGADGEFTFYEDENDNYNYEKGVFATIPLKYDDAQRTLTIGARSGSFPGMLMTRTFKVVFVSAGHGVGGEETAKADQTISYAGTTVVVNAP